MPLIDNPRHAPTYSFTHEQLIAALDQNGIDRAVDRGRKPVGRLQRLHPGSTPRPPRAAARHRHLQWPGGTICAGAMSRDGFVGMRLPFIGLPKLPDITTFNYRALFRRLADLNWHVHPHVEGEDLPKILPVLEASGVKIVVDHLGRPDPTSGVNSEGFKALLRSIDTGPHLGQAVRRLPARATGTGICARACSRRRPRSAGVGERTARSSATRANSRTRPPSTG